MTETPRSISRAITPEIHVVLLPRLRTVVLRKNGEVIEKRTTQSYYPEQFDIIYKHYKDKYNSIIIPECADLEEN